MIGYDGGQDIAGNVRGRTLTRVGMLKPSCGSDTHCNYSKRLRKGKERCKKNAREKINRIFDLTLALSLEERDSKILIGRRSFFSSTFIPSPLRRRPGWGPRNHSLLRRWHVRERELGGCSFCPSKKFRDLVPFLSRFTGSPTTGPATEELKRQAGWLRFYPETAFARTKMLLLHHDIRNT